MNEPPFHGARAPLAKVCGLRRQSDVCAARDAGADLIGLVFALSRRRVTIEEAYAVLASVPGHPPAVGVFVDAEPMQMDLVAREVGLAFLQLSGHEAAEAAALLQTPYIKAIHVDSMSREESLHIMKLHRKASAFIIDSPSALGGGSGRLADWSVARELVARCDRPVLLAGGLNPENVTEGLTSTAAAGADVSSGVEIDGWKDAGRIEAFVMAVRRAGGATPYSRGERIGR